MSNFKTDNNLPIEIFLSYSHKDEKYMKKIESFLSIFKRQGLIECWSDRKIVPGVNWNNEINSKINEAKIILLLISIDFIASDYCYGLEMKLAMEMHEEGKARVIPIILRSLPTGWGKVPFGEIQGLPKDAKPISEWSNKDKAYSNVADGIEKVIKEIKANEISNKEIRLSNSATIHRSDNEKKILRQKNKSKIIFFEFDGTLINNINKCSIWETIWRTLGYELEDCAKYHKQYSDKLISHQQWCDLTRDKFRQKELSFYRVKEIAREIKLIEGTIETLKFLKENGYKLYLLSGSIKIVIKEIMGELYNVFEDVRANEFMFDGDGIIKEIYSTKFDFEGKAIYIKQIIEENRINPNEVLFIGSSNNDVYAIQSGAVTLCINPFLTNVYNANQWDYYVRDLTNLNQIIPYVLLEEIN